MSNTATTYLKYANVQMAAEALFGQKNKAPGSTFVGSITPDVLTLGNDRSGKFTNVLADQFSQDWTVVEHISDTTTGFSGTLFKCLTTDPARGLTAGELMRSFGSTEFMGRGSSQFLRVNADATRASNKSLLAPLCDALDSIRLVSIGSATNEEISICAA